MRITFSVEFSQHILFHLYRGAVIIITVKGGSVQYDLLETKGISQSL